MRYGGLFKFLTATALLNVGWLLFISTDEVTAAVEARKTRVAVALIISAAALLLRKTNAVVISCVALMWVVLEYVLWWVGSFRVVNAAGTSFSNTPHTAFLLQATWWDLCVLLATIVSLVWGIRLLKRRALP